MFIKIHQISKFSITWHIQPTRRLAICWWHKPDTPHPRKSTTNFYEPEFFCSTCCIWSGYCSVNIFIIYITVHSMFTCKIHNNILSCLIYTHISNIRSFGISILVLSGLIVQRYKLVLLKCLHLTINIMFFFLSCRLKNFCILLHLYMLYKLLMLP